MKAWSALLLCFLSACSAAEVELVRLRSQARANQILCCLNDHGIAGDVAELSAKRDLWWRVTVPADRVDEARALCEGYGFRCDDRDGVADLEKSTVHVDTLRSRLQDDAARCNDLERKLEALPGITRAIITYASVARNARSRTRKLAEVGVTPPRQRVTAQLTYVRPDSDPAAASARGGSCDRTSIHWVTNAGFCVQRQTVDAEGRVRLQTVPADDPLWPVTPRAIADQVAAAIPEQRLEDVVVSYVPVLTASRAAPKPRDAALVATASMGGWLPSWSLFAYAVAISLALVGLLGAFLRARRN